ncbi:hypothetical protein RHS01_09465 [Rhizoctonia solani]|uniref:Uncharacterized protein n=1 Tax=Rhizoctonia solani TaxID=456999 RepID=A0A8H7I3W6_9AGAM|nr:hypothetical protein RHS01_09465 [Rhizoctonia solani]
MTSSLFPNHDPSSVRLTIVQKTKSCRVLDFDGITPANLDATHSPPSSPDIQQRPPPPQPRCLVIIECRMHAMQRGMPGRTRHWNGGRDTRTTQRVWLWDSVQGASRDWMLGNWEEEEKREGDAIAGAERDAAKATGGDANRVCTPTACQTKADYKLGEGYMATRAMTRRAVALDGVASHATRSGYWASGETSKLPNIHLRHEVDDQWLESIAARAGQCDELTVEQAACKDEELGLYHERNVPISARLSLIRLDFFSLGWPIHTSPWTLSTDSSSITPPVPGLNARVAMVHILGQTRALNGFPAQGSMTDRKRGGGVDRSKQIREARR